MQRRLVLTTLALAIACASGMGASSARAGGPQANAPTHLAARDLSGTWDIGNYTELERPKGIANLLMTPAEAEAFEAPRRALHGMAPTRPGSVGQGENEWLDRGDGLTRIRGQARSSTVVDPPDGHLPYNAHGLVYANGPGSTIVAPGGLDNPEEVGGNARCVTSPTTGPPMLATPDANLVQLMQTRTELVIWTEKFHDVRIVRLFADAKAAAAAPRDPPSWLGSSVGWWEGDSLAIRTEGFHEGVIVKGQRIVVSAATRVTERLTRISPIEIFYEFTVEDPVLLSRPWRGESIIHPARGPIFEFACHEGNYAMGGMLAGARREEREAASVAK